MKEPEFTGNPPDLTQEELEELYQASQNLLKNPLKARNPFKSFIRIFSKKWDDRTEVAYKVFKPYYDRAGIKFTKADAQIARENMLSLSKNLLKVYQEHTDEISGDEDE
jgi:hypothetical protein